MNREVTYYPVPLIASFESEDVEFLLRIASQSVAVIVVIAAASLLWLWLLNRSTPKLTRDRVRFRDLARRLVGDHGFLLVSGAALLIRLIAYNKDPLYSQEATYISESFGWGNPLLVLLNPVGIVNLHPPLFRSVASVLKLVSDSELLLRLPSVVMGAAGVGFAFKLSRRLFGGAAGWLCAAALMVSPTHIFFSQRLMPYAWMTMFALAALLMLQEYLDGPEDKRTGYLWWAAVFNALGMYSHASYVMIVVAQVACMAFVSMKRRSRYPLYMMLKSAIKTCLWFLPSALFAVLMLISYDEMLKGIFLRMGVFFDVESLVKYFAASVMALMSCSWSTHGVFALNMFVIATLGASMLYLAARRGEAFFIVSMPIVFFLALYFTGYSLAMPPPMLPLRYMQITTAFTFLTLSGLVGVSLQRGFAPGAVLGAAVMGLCIVTGAIGAWGLLTKPATPDFRSATSYIESRLRDGDALAVSPGFFFADTFLYYYFDRDVSWLNRSDFYSAWLDIKDGDGQFYISVNNALIPYEESMENLFIRRVWFVETAEDLLGIRSMNDDAARHIVAALDGRYRHVSASEFHLLKVHLYERLPELDAAFMPEGCPWTEVLEIGENDYYYLKNFHHFPIKRSPGGREPVEGAAAIIPLTMGGGMNALITLRFSSRVDDPILATEYRAQGDRAGTVAFPPFVACGGDLCEIQLWGRPEAPTADGFLEIRFNPVPDNPLTRIEAVVNCE